MPLKRTLQSEKSQKEKILENLILIMEISDYGQLEIARKLGYSKDVFSQIKSGHSNGSTQLLSALEILRELIELKKSGVRLNVNFLEEIRVMRRRLDDLEKQLRVPYPEHKPDPMLLNEPKDVSSCAEADSEDTKLARAAEKEYPREVNPAPKSKQT